MTRLIAACGLLMMLLCGTASAQPAIIVLDASGSMWGRVEDRTKIAIIRGDAGKPAITHYEVAERFPRESGRAAIASLIECHLETGRTHQIRVHMAHIGHPLIGDPEYGAAFKTKANRLPDEARKIAG